MAVFNKQNANSSREDFTMRYFKKQEGRVAEFENDQLTKFELIDKIAELNVALDLTDQHKELVSSKNALDAIDINAIDVAAAQSALDSSTFALDLKEAQHEYDLETSDENKEALDLAKAAYKSCEEYAAIEAAKDALELYQIAVQRAEIAQSEYESCEEYIALERIKSTRIWIPNDAIEMTDEEIYAHVNPVITDEQLAATARAQRDALLDQFTWRYERHAREARLGIETTDSLLELDAYAQALADVPQQEGFPSAIDWPEVPA